MGEGGGAVLGSSVYKIGVHLRVFSFFLECVTFGYFPSFGIKPWNKYKMDNHLLVWDIEFHLEGNMERVWK